MLKPDITTLLLHDEDNVGDLLRQFYAMYGMPEEGPPIGLNVSNLCGSTASFDADLEKIRAAMNDEVAKRQFQKCRKALDDLTESLVGEQLLREFAGVSIPSDDRFQKLSSGILWFDLASSLDTRDRGLPVTQLDQTINLPLSMKIQKVVHGSLVLRLYVALVYMKEGVLNDMINECVRAGGPCSMKVNKFLKTDYLRRIRNALSHGTFSTSIVGIVFRDDAGVIVSTPGFLKWLCEWVVIIQLQALTAGRVMSHVD